MCGLFAGGGRDPTLKRVGTNAILRSDATGDDRRRLDKTRAAHPQTGIRGLHDGGVDAVLGGDRLARFEVQVVNSKV